MLDRLPTELLLRTLELAAPLDYSPSFYLERRLLLRNLSLVSKKLCNIAQPMLPEVFRIESEAEAALLAFGDKRKKRSSAVKLLVLANEVDGSLSDRIDLPSLLKACANLVEVRVLSAGDFSLEWLKANPGLKRLVIWGGGCDALLPPSSDTIFPFLLEISLANVKIAGTFWQSFPTLVGAPRLRRLGIIAPVSLDGAGARLGDLCPALLKTLDVLALHTEDHYLDTYNSNGVPPAALVLTAYLNYETTFYKSFAKLPQRVRLQLYTEQTNVSRSEIVLRDAQKTVDGLVKRLSPASTASSSSSTSTAFALVLPSSLSRALDGSEELRVLVDTVRRGGGDVIEEEEPDVGFESLFTPSVCEQRRSIEKEV